MSSSMSPAATISGFSRNHIVAWAEAIPRLEPLCSESTISTLELPGPAWPTGAALSSSASSVSSLETTEGIRARDSLDVALERGVRKAASAAGIPSESTQEALARVAGFDAYRLRRRDALAPSSESTGPTVASRPARGQTFGRRTISKVRGLFGGNKADRTSGTSTSVRDRPIKVLFQTGHRCTTEDYLSDFKLAVWTDVD